MMAYSYKPSSRAFRFPKRERSPVSPALGSAVEHHFDTFSASDASSTFGVEDSDAGSQKLPSRLLVALTCGIGGYALLLGSNSNANVFSLQLVWSTIFSHGSAYLFSLGISKPQSSLIWAIAPICGTVVHPIIGAISDSSRLPWGRRRPFILGGTVAIIISLTTLAWIRSLSLSLSTTFQVHSEETVKVATQYGAILCILVLNLAIQPLQSGIRALMIDVCPSEQQSIASAWASRFSGLGNILGYILGSVPLSFISSEHEAWRFRYLSLLSMVILVITVTITMYYIQEDNPRDSTYESQDGLLPLRIYRNVRQGYFVMSPRVRHVCRIQFFAWMGWFGFLFYSTSYVSRLYMDRSRRHGVEYSAALQDSGMRVGTTASLLSAIVALGTTILLPHVAQTTPNESYFSEKVGASRRFEWMRQTHVLWTMSHILYASCMITTLFVSTSTAGTLLFSLIGISWGVTQWAPFAIIGEEIAMYQAERESAPESGGKMWISNQSGAIMGVHNAAISLPQILAALGCSFIFWVGKKNCVGAGVGDSIGWVLRASGMAALVAAWFAWRLRREL